MSCDICGGSIETDREWVRARGEDFCSVCASDEIENLRDRVDELEESIRWRKWPGERPEKEGRYQVVDGTNLTWNYFNLSSEEWDFDDVNYWRPIGPLPGE